MKTNLAQQQSNDNSDFLVGDVVVFIDSLKPEGLMTVHRVQTDSLLLNGNRTFTLSHLVRHADIREIQDRKRHIMSFDEAFGIDEVQP